MITLTREQIKALSIFSTKTDLVHVVIEPHPQQVDSVMLTLWDDKGQCVKLELSSNGKGVLAPSPL